MDDLLVIVAVTGAAFVGFTLAGVTGVGGGIITLPVLIWALGVREAIPALAVSQLIAAVARVSFNRKDISWRVVRWFNLGALPAAALGSILFVATPSSVLTRTLGGLILLIVLFRHTPWGKGTGMTLRWFMPVGAASGFLSGLVGAVGPLLVPFYFGYGLFTSAYVGTSAFNVLAMQVPRLSVYGSDGLLGTRTLSIGVGIGLVAFLGSYVGRTIVGQMSARLFLTMVEGILVLSGLLFVLRG